LGIVSFFDCNLRYYLGIVSFFASSILVCIHKITVLYNN